MNNLEQRLIVETQSLRDALEAIDAAAGGLLLVIDADGALVRTVSDGDLRRAILQGFELDSEIAELKTTQPWVVSTKDSPTTAYLLMEEHKINEIPQVSADGKPERIFTRRDFETNLPLSTPHLGSFERQYVEEAFETNWVAPLGPNLDAFERELAEIVDVPHAVAVSSGTAALHLALAVIGVSKGDTVLTSDLTFVASVNPILYLGAKPVLIDCEPHSWNMSPKALEAALIRMTEIGRPPKAIVSVNLYGQQAEMNQILPLAERFSVPVIEDAAESLGATYHGKHSGTFGVIGIYSFNGNKIITTSGGGMLVSNNESLIERARFLSTQAKEPAPYYLHKEVGYNYRMSNVLAGIGRGQLKVLEERVDARRRVFMRYKEALLDFEELHWFEEPERSKSTHWLSCCLIEPKSMRHSPSEIIAALREENIEARHIWQPMHMQPLFAATERFPNDGSEMRSSRHFAQGICLPSGSNMTEGQQERAISAIRRHLADAD